MTPAAQDSWIDEYAHLIGRLPVRDVARFVRNRSVEGARADDEELARRWKEARVHVLELEKSEAGCADSPQLAPLPDEMRPTAEAAAEHIGIQRAARYTPNRWYLVDIDQLVVFQPWINLGFVAEIRRALPEEPSQMDLIRVATGMAWPTPRVQVTQVDNNFYFSSRSADLRFLDVVPLDPRCAHGYEPSGTASHVIGIYVGFGPNLLSACLVRNRLVLTNGSHRVYALRELGVRRVPCLVKEVTSEEDFDVATPQEVKQNPEAFLRNPRPPMAKDYLNPALRMLVKVPRVNMMLHAQFTLQKAPVAAV